MKEDILLSTNIPPITPEFFEHLERSFPQRDIKPDTRIEEIMYRAGQKSVIEFTRRSVVGRTITGKPQTWFHKLALKYWREE